MAIRVTHPLATGIPPRFAVEWGEDRFGVFLGVDLGGAVQRMRWIVPGAFTMGSPETERDRRENEPEKRVVFERGFWMGETAVTQAAWRGVMGENPSRFHGDSLPVERVSFEDAERFLWQWSKSMETAYLRLPSEAEWEYACRAGTTTRFSFGDDVTPAMVNFDDESPRANPSGEGFRQQTVPVTSLPPNGWGLYEMHGNVWEWCTDRSVEHVGWRVVRGGSWFARAARCRSAARFERFAEDREPTGGFRVVLDV